ncbi:MAG: DUF6287 domain-containing protein [Streptococcus sp.]
MDVNAIKDNNFQSLEGTWKNGNGNSLTFSKDQVTAPTDYEVQNANSSLENGYLRASLRTGMYGAIIFFIPKVRHYRMFRDYPDASDNTKDRILVTQSEVHNLTPNNSTTRLTRPDKGESLKK